MMASKTCLSARTVQSAFALRCDTTTSPFLTSTNQRSGRSPVTSKRNVPVARLSSGSCPRVPSSAKKSAVASAIAVTLLADGARSSPGAGEERITARGL